MQTIKNQRRHRRIPYIGPVRISWEDQGNPCFAAGHCIDMSDEGLRIELVQRLRPGAMVQVAAERLRLTGTAHVKHIERSGGKFLLGLNLTEALLSRTIADLEGGQR